MELEFKKYYFIVTSNTLVKRLGRIISLGDGAMAITIFPFIFVRTDTRHNEELIRHERIHILQQIELFLIGTWILFLLEFLYAKYIKHLDSRQSYYFTAMEQEAHRNAYKENYLEIRKQYAILKYIKNKKWLARG